MSLSQAKEKLELIFPRKILVIYFYFTMLVEEKIIKTSRVSPIHDKKAKTLKHE